MIRKLNNKGMTAIEILITFVIVVVIVVSMYDGIMDLKNKETVASYKLSLTTYKNLLTKDIQDDLIKVGLSAVSMESMKDGSGDAIGYRIRMTLRDGSIRLLEVKQIFGCNAIDSLEADELCIQRGIDKNQSDDFSISYGPEGNLTEYPLPDLGHEEIDNFGASGTHTVYSLRINEVDVSTANSVFSVRIVLYHPDMGTEQSIDIVAPMNLSSMDKTDDSIGNISATIRENNSEGDILENKNEWTNKTLWFGEFRMDSENAIDRFEYSKGCTGSVTGVLNMEGETFSTTQDTQYCIRGVDSTGQVSEWSTPYYFRIDKTEPTCGSTSGERTTWAKTNVSITQYCEDSHSGCSESSVKKEFSTEGKTDTINITDKAGNSRSCTVDKYIDKTPPKFLSKIQYINPSNGYSYFGWVIRDDVSGVNGTTSIWEYCYTDHKSSSCGATCSQGKNGMTKGSRIYGSELPYYFLEAEHPTPASGETTQAEAGVNTRCVTGYSIRTNYRLCDFAGNCAYQRNILFNF